MINKTKNWKFQRNIRRWADRNSEKVYDTLGRFCKKCKATEDLSIHHKEYKPGIEYLEILCQKCHRRFHNLETQKRLLTIIIKEIEEFQKTHTLYSIEELKEWLQIKINKIPVDLIPNLEINGFQK